MRMHMRAIRILAIALAGAALCVPSELLVSQALSEHDHHGHAEHGHGHAEHDDEHGHGENATTLSERSLEAADLGIETAGPKIISTSVHVYGRMLANDNRVAHVKPRFAGVITGIEKDLGERVEKGDLLAVVESNQSLQPYEIRSRIAGMVIQRHSTLGEFVDGSQEIFVVADLSELWADFLLYRDDLPEIVKGQEVSIDLGDGNAPIQARIDYISPLIDEATQSKLIRAVLPNADGKLKPGLFISGNLAVSHSEVPLAVSREALQSMDGSEVVFVTDGRKFEARPVKVGRRDSWHAEIVSGLGKGERYVSRNSYIVKADIEKSAAGHDHDH